MKLVDYPCSPVPIWTRLLTLCARTRGSKLLSDFSWVLIGSALSRVARFGAFAIAARGLGPADYGVFSMASAVMLSGATLMRFGLDTATVTLVARLDRPETRVQVASAIWLSLRVRLTIAVVFVVVSLPLTGQMGEILFHRVGLGQTLALGVVAAAVLSLWLTVLAAFQGLRKFKTYLWLNLLADLGILLVIAFAIFVGKFSLNLLLSMWILLPLVSTLWGCYVLPRPERLQPHLQSHHLSELFRFSKWITLGTYALLALRSLDVIVLAWYAPDNTVGLYGASRNLAQMVSFFGATIATLLLPYASRLEERQIRSYLRRATMVVAPIGMAGLVVFWFTAAWLMKMTLGSEYLAGAFTFRIIGISAIVDLLLVPFSVIWFPLNRPAFLALQDIIRAFVGIVGYFLLVPLYKDVGVALATLFASVVSSSCLVVIVTCAIPKVDKRYSRSV